MCIYIYISNASLMNLRNGDALSIMLDCRVGLASDFAQRRLVNMLGSGCRDLGGMACQELFGPPT